MAIQYCDVGDLTLLKLVSFVFWGWLYIWCCQTLPHQQPEWYSRVVTLLHGSVATIGGLEQCDIMNLTPYKLTMRLTASHYALMLWSWGYFTFDLLWCVVYCPENYVMLLHHLIAIIGCNTYMGKEYTGCTFACSMVLMEITNPLLQTRWFMREAGCRDTTIFFLVELTYLISFVFIRAILCSYLVIKIIVSDIFDTDEKVISVILYLVSLALVVEVVGYVTYRYFGKNAKFSHVASILTSIFNENR